MTFISEDMPGWDWRTMGNRRGSDSVGPLIRVTADKVERELARMTYHPCTVLRILEIEGVAGSTADVHMDGDAPATFREVTISSAYNPRPGDRAQVAYVPPHGAMIVAPLSEIGGGNPAAAIRNLCGGSLPSISVPVGDEVAVAFCCEEFATGGMQTDNGTIIRVPETAVYSVHGTVHATADPGMLFTARLIATDYADPIDTQTVDAGLAYTIQLGRAAIVLQEGAELFIEVSNDGGNDITLGSALLDCTWEVPYNGEVVRCTAGGDA